MIRKHVRVYVRGLDDPARIAARTKALIGQGEHVAWIGRERVMVKAMTALETEGWAGGRAVASSCDGRKAWIWTPVGQQARHLGPVQKDPIS